MSAPRLDRAERRWSSLHSHHPGRSKAMNPVETSVRELLDAYKAAVWDRNVDDFLNLYEPEARVFDTWAVWCYDGVAGRRAAIGHWFGSLGNERVRVAFADLQVRGDATLVMASAVC